MGQALSSIPFKQENSCFTGKLICAYRAPFSTEFVFSSLCFTMMCKRGQAAKKLFQQVKLVSVPINVLCEWIVLLLMPSELFMDVMGW